MIKAGLAATALLLGVFGLLGGMLYLTEQPPAFVHHNTVRKAPAKKRVAREKAASVIVTEAPLAATPEPIARKAAKPRRSAKPVAQGSFLNASVIRGQAMSSTTRRPLAYARVYAAGNAHRSSGLLAVADREGHFEITLQRNMGPVQVLIEHPGYQDHTVTFPVGSSSEQDLGSFFLRSD